VKTLPFYDLERELKDIDLMSLAPTTPPIAHTVIVPHQVAGWTGMEKIKTLCLGIVLLELENLRPQENALLTPREAARAEELGPRRRKPFLGARLALKSLARQIGLASNDTPDSWVQTLGPDRVRPCVAESGIYCSVSHDSRFIVAVADVHPVGVDIEIVSEKPVRSSHLFMPSENSDLLLSSGLGRKRAATRAWTSKEATAKAFGLDLSDVFRKVKIVRVGEQESDVRYRGKAYSVKHAEGEGHVLSLFTCGDV